MYSHYYFFGHAFSKRNDYNDVVFTKSDISWIKKKIKHCKNAIEKRNLEKELQKVYKYC